MHEAAEAPRAAAETVGGGCPPPVRAAGPRAPGARPAGPEPSPSSAEGIPVAAMDEGAALFVTKGCVVCHVNGNVQESESFSLSIGPDLTRYSNDPAFLAGWLADPADVRPGTKMPDLGLKPDEIDALIAFLNGEGDA